MPEKYRREIVNQKRAFSPIVVCLLCASLTLAASYLAYQSSRMENTARFDRTTLNLVNSFKNRMSTYINSLVYARNLFETKPDLNANEFYRFIDGMELQRELPGMQTIGYVKHIHRKDLAKEVAKFPPRKEPITFEQKPSYDIVMFSKSLVASTNSAVGMDLSVSPERTEAMLKAATTGIPVATDTVTPISIKNPTPNDRSFIVFIPHYKNGMPQSTPAERLKALAGFMYGGFRATNLFGEVLDDARPRKNQIILNVYDGDEIKESNLIFSQGKADEANSNYHKSVVLEAAERKWTVDIRATDEFTLPYSRFFPWFILLVGACLSAAVTFSSLRADKFAGRLIEDIDRRLAAETQLREEKQIVELVAKIGTTLKAEQDLSQIVQMVTDTGVQLTLAKFGAFFYNVVTENNEALMLYTLSGANKADFEKFSMPRPTPVFKPTFDGTGTIRSDDITKDPRYGKMGPHFGMPKGHLPVRSYLAVPVISKNGKVMGGLFFGHPEIGIFTERAETIAKSLAIQAGVAMDNAFLYRDLDTANRAKSIFLANVSHEIRTPLGIMLGFAELVHENSHDHRKVEEYASNIVRNGRELTRIIGDVLDLSKIEANTLLVECTEVSLHKFLDNIMASWEPKAQEKGLDFKLNITGEIPKKIYTDVTRLKQIFVNLISNAIKFTEKGYVHLNVHLRADTHEMIFTVEDSGPGISLENQTHLFKSFSQGDSSITRKYGGSGLGLALSQQLARALKGDLVLLKSEQNVGSTFSLTLPVNAHDASMVVSKHSHEEEKSLKDVRVLLVEDSSDNQVLISLFLNKANAKVETANNGEEGVTKALSGNFDVVLMDIQMPVMDGYRAMEKLQQTGFTKPVLALTAHALKEEKEKALASGFTGYLTKPVDRHLLVSTIHSVVN